MNDYTKGILTGVSLILCFFMFVSAKSQSGNLGDVVVNSVSVIDENADLVGRFDGRGLILAKAKQSPTVVISVGVNGGVITTHSKDGIMNAYLGTAETGGVLNVFNVDGKSAVYLGTSQNDGGILQTFNQYEVNTGYFGTNKYNDGMAILFDRYGDEGWNASGKK